MDAGTTDDILSLRGQRLRVSYGNTTAVVGMDFDVPQGIVVSVIGPNGAGKTSVAKAIAGLLPHGGSLHLGDMDLTDKRPHERAASGLSYVPDGRGVFPELTVKDQIRLASEHQFNVMWPQLCEAFPLLADKANHHASHLSGGQQQITSIARALASSPKFIVLDEPSMGLSPVAVKEVVDAIDSLRSGGIGVLLVEQNVRLALELSSRCYVLVRGEVRAEGSPEELQQSSDVEALYMGQSKQQP